MNIVRECNWSVPYSLHDAWIKRIDITEKGVRVVFDYIFDYSATDEKTVEASIFFEGMDVDDTEVFVFDIDTKNGDMVGKRYDLQEFCQSFAVENVFILTETYNGYDTLWRGTMRTESADYQVVFSLWSMGNMVYEIGEEK